MDPSPAATPTAEPVGVRSRLLGLSDHVFGFAATLLAARLVLPGDLTGNDPLDAIGERAGTIGVYAVGFLVIGYQWWRHHQVFGHIERTSGAMRWLNLLLLSFIAVMPYPTSVLGESRVSLAVAMYVVPLLCSGLLLLAIWGLAVRRGLTDLRPGADRHRSLVVELLILPAVLTTSLVLLLVGPTAAIAAWALLPIVLLVAHRALPAHDDETSPLDRLRTTASGYVDDGLERLVAYSDGIYAVVLTIIAEQLGGDERRSGADLTDAQLWDQVASQWHTFAAFGLTFFTVGLFWTVHAEIFGRIIRLRTPLLWLTLVHLMVIALQPFGQSLYVDFGGGDDSDATAIYLAVMLVASLSLSVISVYADWRNRCVDPHASDAARLGHHWQGAAAAAIFTVAIVVALVTDDGDSSWAFATLALFPVTDAVISRRFPESVAATVSR